MNLKDLFHYHLSFDYPSGMPCLFYPDKYRWTSLCHIQSGGSINRTLCENIFGNGDIIDVPLLNVIPGSTEANIENYTTKISVLPPQVIYCARNAIDEYNNKSKNKIPIGLFLTATQNVNMLKQYHEYFSHALHIAITAKLNVLDEKYFSLYSNTEAK